MLVAGRSNMRAVRRYNTECSVLRLRVERTPLRRKMLLMRRVQLFEFEDMPWFPVPIRNAVTDLLRFMLNLTDGYAPIAPHLIQALRDTNSHRIVDLCSGGGGPWRRMITKLHTAEMAYHVLLTDRFPNPESIVALPRPDQTTGHVSYHPAPVDVLKVPPELVGFRTLFSALHHFPRPRAAAILADAVAQRAPIGVFEATRRDLPSILVTLLIAPLFTLLVTPLIRPFRLSRLLFTYLIPVVPLLVAWDGIVSCLRTYTPDELRGIVAAVPNHASYEWRIGEAHGQGPIAVTYLIGLPKEQLGEPDRRPG